MAKKHSLIGFTKTKYKSVKFESREQLKEKDFIKFYYGPFEANPKNLKPIVGKITKLLDKGVEIYTDYGWMHSEWNRIDRVFKIKTTGRLKHSKIPSVSGLSPIPLLDAALDRLKQIIQEEYNEIQITDVKKNTVSTFSRKLSFKKDGNVISLNIPNKNATEVDVKGLKRKTSLKVAKNKISQSTFKRILTAIQQLSETNTQGISDL